MLTIYENDKYAAAILLSTSESHTYGYFGNTDAFMAAILLSTSESRLS